MTDFKKYALSYISKGLSVIPISENKIPQWNWNVYQKRFMTEEEVDKAFNDGSNNSIGIVCGKISGGFDFNLNLSLTVIDIDSKNFDSSISYEDICKSIPESLLSKLLIASTKNDGRHWYFKSKINKGNQKFALRPTSVEEQSLHPNEKIRVMIESRGEGGMVAAFPTKGYNIISDIKKIPTITIEEHNCIIDAMCSFNQVIDEMECYEKFAEEKNNLFLINPFDDFNEKADLLGLLLSNGYTIVGNRKKDDVILKRPGNSLSSHSGYYAKNKNRYVNFSTSSEFESGKSYSPCEVFTKLECNGDWKTSYKKIIELGYGHSVDMKKRISDFIAAHKEGNLDALMKIHFGAEKTPKGYKVNGTFYKC